MATANPESPIASVLRQALKLANMESVSTPDFRNMAVLSVAAECCFASSADARMEAWEPYVEWASKLDHNDTIATFNYDTALETIGAVAGNLVRNLGAETVVLPQEQKQLGKTNVPILKLHGSVSWSIKGTPGRHEFASDLKLDEAFEHGFTPLLGTPGPTKKRMRHGHFGTLWNMATEAISKADTIVFLGYRFPPSDSASRLDLLKAIKSNSQTTHLKVHTVLGPNTSHPDTIRLQKMLNVVLEDSGREPVPHRGGSPNHSFYVVAQPLYVEDFLSVLSHDFLHM